MAPMLQPQHAASSQDGGGNGAAGWKPQARAGTAAQRHGGTPRSHRHLPPAAMQSSLSSQLRDVLVCALWPSE